MALRIARSLAWQVRNTPLRILADRAKAIARGAPILRDMTEACQELLALMNRESGKIEASKIQNITVRWALRHQGIEQIKVENWDDTATEDMLIILNRAAAGMEEGRIYKYITDPLAYFSDVEVIKLIRKGSGIKVSRSLNQRSGILGILF